MDDASEINLSRGDDGDLQFAGDDDDDAVTHPPKWTVSGLGRTTTSAPDADAAASDSASDAASADRIVGSGRALWLDDGNNDDRAVSKCTSILGKS